MKKADIGIAMGMGGTEVSKDAASMILADDNFATIIKAAANGRNVYRNIKNAIQFLLSGNMAGILCVLYTSLLGLPLPFAPVHLLFINLITDSLPAIAIGMEPAEDGLLKKPPRDPKEGILTPGFVGQIFFQGGSIIYPVARHGYDMPPVLPCFYNAYFMLRRYAGINRNLRQLFFQFFFCHLIQPGSCKRQISGQKNADPACYSHCRCPVISCDHNRAYSGLTGRSHCRE